MFLPIVLLRDFGIWGFIAFAVPNVIGAASVGWVIRTQNSAKNLLQKHALAIGLFSAVTIAFHVYWLAWIGTWVPGVLGLERSVVALMLGLAVLLLAAFNLVANRSLVAASVPLWLLSATLFGTLLGTGTVDGSIPTTPDNNGLALLAPVMVFGFALCPYLDGTFLTARASLNAKQARFAFGFGFGVLFLCMIVGTVLYAPLLSTAFDGKVAAQWIGGFLLCHLLIQAAFSITVHRRLSPLRAVPAPILCGFLLVAAAAAVGTRFVPMHAGLDAGEIGYRAFLGFYGLAFPAYVWLVMIPARHTIHDHKKLIRIWAASVGLATPMFWMGFVERQELWLAIGLFVVLAARLFSLQPKRESSVDQSVGQ